MDSPCLKSIFVTHPEHVSRRMMNDNNQARSQIVFARKCNPTRRQTERGRGTSLRGVGGGGH